MFEAKRLECQRNAIAINLEPVLDPATQHIWTHIGRIHAMPKFRDIGQHAPLFLDASNHVTRNFICEWMRTSRLGEPSCQRLVICFKKNNTDIDSAQRQLPNCIRKRRNGFAGPRVNTDGYFFAIGLY